MGQSITYKDVECLRINVKPILASICEHALQWKTILGEKLSKKTKDNMVKLRNEIQVCIDVPLPLDFVFIFTERVLNAKVIDLGIWYRCL